MKKLTSVMFVLALVGAIVSCSKKCDNEMPRARVLNNGTMVVSVQIKTSDGNTVNLNNIDPGQFSDYASYAAGLITFTITVDKIPYVQAVTMGNCFQYDIAIDANNVVTTAATDRNN